MSSPKNKPSGAFGLSHFERSRRGVAAEQTGQAPRRSRRWSLEQTYGGRIGILCLAVMFNISIVTSIGGACTMIAVFALTSAFGLLTPELRVAAIALGLALAGAALPLSIGMWVLNRLFRVRCEHCRR